MSSPFNPGAISLGAGRLYDGPLGTATPVDHSTALDPALTPIGYTEDGSAFSWNVSNDPVPVAESLFPVAHKTTSVEGTVTFAMAEDTIKNWQRALNGGTVTPYGTGPTAGLKFTPPNPGQEVRRLLVWESEDKLRRIVFKQLFQGGSVEAVRRPGATKTTLPVEFRIEQPADGSEPFEIYYAEVYSGGATATV
jgi:hypothetical protein